MPQDYFELLQKAEILSTMGDYRGALELLSHAEHLALENKRQDAAIHVTKGNILGKCGNFENARKCLEHALEIYEQLAVIDQLYDERVAGTQNDLGLLLYEMGRLEDAKSRYEQALKVHETLLNADPESAQYQFYVATTQNNFGLLLYDIGRFEEAELRYEKALKMYEILLNTCPESAKYRSDAAMTQNNLGNLLRATGRLEEAKLRYEKALKVREALLDTYPESAKYQSDVAMTQNNLGILLYNMRRFEEAELRYGQALKIYEILLNTYPESAQCRSDVAMTHNNIGNLLYDMGRFEEAKLRCEKALKGHEALLNIYPESAKYQSDVAGTQNNLGNLLRATGRLEEAKLRYEKALKVREALLHTYPESAKYQSDVAMTQNNLGILLREEGNHSKALIYFSEALNLISPSGNPDLVFRIFLARGSCYEKRGNLNQAYEDYRESIERIELIRSQFSLEEYKIDILRDKTDVYSDMISFLCIKMNDTGRAWEYVGRAKSRTMLDCLRLIKLPVPQSIPKDLQSKEKELLEAIGILDRQSRTTERADQASSLSQEITKLQSELDKLYDQIEDLTPEYVDLRRGRPLPIGGIIDLLEKQSKKTAFVEYYTTPDKVFIFVIHSDDSKPKVKTVDISSQRLTNYVIRYFQEIVNFPYMQGIEETWQELAGYLIAPILEDIDGCDMLYLIPHGLLHYLPIHALCINGKRLIEHFPVTYASSLTAIKYAQRKGWGTLNSCLSMGFTPDEEETELFEGEADLVANLFKTKPYLGENVTRQLLINVDKDVIHLSCHGYFNPQEPLNSGLHLSDGMLMVKDIFNMNIKADLLVLSACGTGLNEQKPGDELIGLTRAFLYSGTRSIMVSLWPVCADSTLKLMESFYNKMKDEKMSKAEALQKAQIDMLHNEQYRHPYYWAPFMLIGDCT